MKPTCIALFALLLLPFAAQANQEKMPLFVVQFTLGPAWDENKAVNEQVGFVEHSTNLKKLRQEGRITFGARYDKVGMIFYHAEDLETATADIEQDPGVQSQIFEFSISELNIFYPFKNENVD